MLGKRDPSRYFSFLRSQRNQNETLKVSMTDDNGGIFEIPVENLDVCP